MTQVGEAFVTIKPVVTDFRAEVARDVDRSLGRTPIAVPVTPKLSTGSAALSWERIAGGAVVPVPITPTITPAGKAAFGNEVSGLRGLLLGSGQFAASRALGISSAAAGLFLFGTAAVAAVKSAATLEQELNVFQQVSGATADQMARVRAEARALGADVSLPAVSAGDAAATMTELAKAGLNVDQVLKGTRGTLQLASAANLDFATSSELVANALNSFQLGGQNAIKVADLLAGASNAAQGNIADFGLGLSQAAAVAHQAGLSVQDTVVFLTELAKAGIQGSDAGTSLRVALLRLIAPTNEARKIFKELGVEITDSTTGAVRTDVFEQLRRSMQNLAPATRNAALATIFGTDAVRAAAIFVRDGARGHEQLARQVERSGQAQETAAARSRGLAGSVGALVSNVQTLGTDIGTIALPALTELAKGASAAASDIDFLVVKVTAAGDKLAGLKVGPFGKLGDIVKNNVKNAVSAPFQPLHASIDLMRGDFRGAAADTEKMIPGLHEARTAIQGLRDDAKQPIQLGQIGPPPGGGALDTLIKGTFGRSGEDVRNAAVAGNEIGSSFSDGVTTGITVHAPAAVQAARRTVEDARRTLSQVVAEGQKAIADTIRQGSVALQAAELDAKQNLASIGQQLAQQALQLLDSGPLADRIQRLQDKLDRSRAGLERGRLRNDLRDAQEELARAEAAIAGGGGSAAQRAAEADFLRPFREKVKDTQAALSEFNTSGTIDKLRARLEAQKARLQRVLDDLIARFNAGLLSAPAANREAAALLEANVGPMSKAGRRQGFAFAQNFRAELAGLEAQITAIAIGPQTRKTGAEPRVVSPAQVAAQAAADVRDAREQATRQQVAASRAVKDSVTSLQRAQERAIDGPAGTNAILREIRDQNKPGRGGSKPSSSVAPPARRTRSGGR